MTVDHEVRESGDPERSEHVPRPTNFAELTRFWGPEQETEGGFDVDAFDLWRRGLREADRLRKAEEAAA